MSSRPSFTNRPGSWLRRPWQSLRDMPLRLKLILIALLITVGGMGSTTWISINRYTAVLTERVEHEMVGSAASEAHYLASNLVERVSAMQALTPEKHVQTGVAAQNGTYTGDKTAQEWAQLDEQWAAASRDDPFVKEKLDNELAHELKHLTYVVPDFAEAFVTDRYGGLVAAGDRTSDYYQGDEGWWQAAYNDGKGAVYIGEPEFDESSGVIGINLAVPVYDPAGQVIGVLRTTLNATALVGRLGEGDLGETGGAGLFLRDRVFAAHEERTGDDAHGGHEKDIVAAMTRASDPLEGHLEANVDGEPSIIAYHALHLPTGEQYISNLGWKVIFHQAKSEALASVNQANTAATILTGSIMVVGAVAAVFIAQMLANPILKLTYAVQRFAAGDRSIRSEATSADEIGTLASSFNQMAEEVDGLLTDIQTRSGELAERTRELEASQRVTFAASERVTPDELLDLVVNLIRDQFNLYHAQVYLVDEEQQAAVLRQSTGYAGRQLLTRKHKIPLDATALVTKAIHTGAPVLVDDTSQDPNFMANPLLPETRSELVVPLKLKEKVVGVLDAQDRTPGRFGPSTVALFQSMADQVAILFENAELLERISEQTESLTIFTTQLRTAAEIARRLGAVLDPDRLLEQAVEMLQSRFGLYHAHVYVVDEATKRLVMHAGSGEVGRVLRKQGHAIPLDAEKSLVARAARSEQTVLVNDTSLESDFMPNPLLPQTRAEVSIPLIAGEKVLGVLDIQDDQPNRFSTADVDTFGTLAGQLATTLQNASLFKQIATFRALAENASDAIGMADLEGRLTYVNRVFCQQMGYDYGRQEMIGLPLASIWPEEDLPTMTGQILPQVMLGGWSGEARVKRHDGSVFDAHVSAFPVLDEGGRPICMAAILRDITERKRAEEEIRKLATVVTHSSELVNLATLDGQMTFINEAGSHMLGIDPTEVAQYTIPHVIPEALMPKVQTEVLPTIIEKGGWEGELQYRNVKTGAVTDVYASTFLITDPETGAPLFLANVSRDITEQKKALAALRENEERLDLAMEAANAGVWEFWPQEDRAFFNDRWFTMLGYEPGELEHSYATWRGLLHPDDVDIAEGAVFPAVAAGGDFVIDFRMRAKDGSFRWIHDIGKTVERTDDGKARRMIGTHTDITEEKTAAQERERFTTQLRTAADLAEQINTILDPEQLLPEVVNELQKRFGLYHVHIYTLVDPTPEQLAAVDNAEATRLMHERPLVLRAGSGEVGRQLLERGHTIPLSREKSLVARAARDRAPVLVNDTAQAPDFMPNPLLPETKAEVAVPLIVGDKVVGVLDVQDNQPGRFTQSDVDVLTTLAGQIATALQNAGYFEEIQQATERLREVDRLKSEFLASMSHELRTPLNSIIGYTEIMLMGLDAELDPEMREDVQAIYDNGQHLLRIINDILDLAKIEAGRLTLDMDEVPVEVLMDAATTSVAGLLANTGKQIAFNVEVEEDLPTIWGDPVRLNQVLNNLTSNAVKFTDEGHITLRAFKNDGWICLEVEDTGIGIAEKEQAKIFERFQQANGSNTHKQQGTGLGLAITRSLVQLHGGTIALKSEVGKGSTFTVQLPIRPPTETHAAEVAVAPAKDTPTPRKRKER